MVSGFFTSPCDHSRMSSAVASPMRSSSKKLTSSTGVCSLPRSDLVDAADALVGAPSQIDTQLLGRPEYLVVRLAHLEGHAVAGEHLNVQAQRLQLLEQHLEGLRDARLRDVLALDDGLVDLHPAEH